MDEANTFLQLPLLVLLGCRKRPLEIVEHRDQLREEPRVRKPNVLLPLTRGALLVVLEVGGEPKEAIVVSRLLLLNLLDLLDLIDQLVLDVLVTHW